MTIISRWGLALLACALAVSLNANAQEGHYRFAHDQQLNSGYSVAYDIFSAKLKELSGGKMLVDQYPGAQLGQEPHFFSSSSPAISILQSFPQRTPRRSRRKRELCPCISCFAVKITWSRHWATRAYSKQFAT
jgi:hypothetical protein